MKYVTFETGRKSCHLEIDRANPLVLSGGSPGRIRRMAQYLDKPEIIESDRGLVTVHGSYREIPVTLFSTGMGSASVSITLPEVIEACDNPKMVVLRLGTAGGLQPYLNIGDFSVTTRVDRMESTSDKIMYPGYIAESNPDVRMVLSEEAFKHCYPFQRVYVGSAEVTDELYFTNVRSKDENHGENITISMEFSAYCALRDRYNRDRRMAIKTGEILVVSDIVVPRVRDANDRDVFNAHAKEIEEAHAIIGLETLLRMSTAN